MLTASQDIDYFIERQRSKLNKAPNRQAANRQRQPPPPRSRPNQPPPPPPPRPPIKSRTTNNLEERLDYKVARILDEPSPRSQPQQTYYPPSVPPPPLPSSFSPIPEEERETPFFPDGNQRRYSNDTARGGNSSQITFFDKFGAHEEKRAQLKEDLKREYNEFLQSQHRTPRSKSLSQNSTPRGKTTRRVQFQQDGLVVAPWEKDTNRTRSIQNINNVSTSSSTATTTRRTEYITNRSLSRLSQEHDEQYIRDREEYILELYEQIRELEARKRQLELESSRLNTTNSTSITRAHYAEDLSALNSLLSERLNQRNTIDLELARILNRPPISSSPNSLVGGSISGINTSFEQSYDISSSSPRINQQFNDNRQNLQYRNDNRTRQAGNDGFQIGRVLDKDAEQADKKRYQLELQSQMRESQMRKAQAKQEKDEYERRLEAEINRYYYFGRSGGGAPMRDKDGNVIANLNDLRNSNQQQPPQYPIPDNKAYSPVGGVGSLPQLPFSSGEAQQFSSSPVRVGSPNHARGAVSNGIFGTVKTEEQLAREEKYKQDLKKQIDEKRQRNAEEVARRRAEEEREIAKHIEWQQQMEKQMAEETLRKQEKELQERQRQQLEEELERQRRQEELDRQRRDEELAIKRKPKRPEKTRTPVNDDPNTDRQNSFEDQSQHPEYRSSSPPVPTIKNKGKNQSSNPSQRQSFDDPNQQQAFPVLPSSVPPFDDNFANTHPITEQNDDQESYRKPSTPKQPDKTPAKKKPPQSFRNRPNGNAANFPIRTNSTISLRSDGSDSEVLNRLEHLKRQLKDKEARLRQHAKSEAAFLSDIEENTTVAYRPPSTSIGPRRQSPANLFETTRPRQRDQLSTNDKLLRVLQTDDDDEFKPSYFRDDSILMRGMGANGPTTNDGGYISPSKRVDLADGIFVTNTEDTVRRRRYGFDPPGFYDRDDPTSMANLELNRIAEQNEKRLKKLRDLEKDDSSLLDNNEVLERFQQRQKLQGRGSQVTLQDDAWLK